MVLEGDLCTILQAKFAELFPRTWVNKPRICFEFIAGSSSFATLPSHADTGRRAEMLYRVARKRADLLKISLVMAAAMLAICLLALVEITNTAEAASS